MARKVATVRTTGYIIVKPTPKRMLRRGSMMYAFKLVPGMLSSDMAASPNAALCVDRGRQRKLPGSSSSSCQERTGFHRSEWWQRPLHPPTHHPLTDLQAATHSDTPPPHVGSRTITNDRARRAATACAGAGAGTGVAAAARRDYRRRSHEFGPGYLVQVAAPGWGCNLNDTDHDKELPTDLCVQRGYAAACCCMLLHAVCAS